jgi:probable rRNA maturation factor
MTSSATLDVLIEDPAWAAFELEVWAQQACNAALAGVNLDPAGFEISLMGCDDARIATLNTDFRGKAQSTNVLSWPAGEHTLPKGQWPALPIPTIMGETEELGDIAIAFGVCQRESVDQDKSFSDHVRHLLVHATLHLLGFDHIHDEDAAVMEELETQILARLGVCDPY